MLIVAAVSLLVQGAHLLGSVAPPADPTFDMPTVDAHTYADAADRFARGEGLSDEAFWQPPLFPLLLGSLRIAMGAGAWGTKIVLALIGAVGGVLTYHIATHLFSKRVGLVAGLIASIYGPLVFFNTQLLPAGLAVTLSLAALALWLSCMERPSWHRWFICGITIGLATINVPNAFVVYLLAGVWLIARMIAGTDRAPAAMAIALLTAGVALPVGAVTIRNYIVAREIVIVSTNGGMNFYLGNNPNADETTAIRPGEYWGRLDRAVQVKGHHTKSDRSRYYFAEVLRFAVEDPAAFAMGLARKALRVVNAREIPRNVDPYAFRDYSPVLGVLCFRIGSFAFPFGLIAPLAAVGIVAALGQSDVPSGRRRARFALLVFALVYAASVTLFFVTSRYRLPIVPAVIVFAAAGVVWIWDRLSAKSACVIRRHAARVAWANLFARVVLQDPRASSCLPMPPNVAPNYARSFRYFQPASRWERRMALLAFGFTTAVTNWPISTPTDHVNFRAELLAHVGQGHEDQGDLEQAKSFYLASCESAPAYALPRRQLGWLAVWADDLERAETLARTARSLDPQSVGAASLLAQVLHQTDRTEEAIELLSTALTADSTHPGANAALADMLLSVDRAREAVEHLRIAVRFADDPGTLQLHLADTLAEFEEYGEAIEQYRRALFGIESDAATLNRIAWLLATCPQASLRDCEQATALAQTACEMTDYRHAVTLDTLAAAHAECGRFLEAVDIAETAIAAAAAEDKPEIVESIQPRLETYRRHAKRTAGDD